jgi:hypothetical protein
MQHHRQALSQQPRRLPEAAITTTASRKEYYLPIWNTSFLRVLNPGDTT